MQQTWRWFGPSDPISLTKIRQAGATGIVTALHDVAVGQAWSATEIEQRRKPIEAAGLSWTVVESLPVHSDIRLQRPGAERLVKNYEKSLQSLAAAGVYTVCYNFMPVIDWTRTSLAYVRPDGSTGLRFDAAQWAAFDVFLLKRPDAETDYTQAELQAAERKLQTMSEAERLRLVDTVAAGLPGANEEGHSLEGLRQQLAQWRDVGPDRLRSHLTDFLREVLPVAERLGIRMCIHPDDPPRPLLGLPRIASCETDFEQLFEELPSPSNGLTLCVGSLGAGTQNDPLAMARRFASRVHFAHLRTVTVDEDGSFEEADHLEGNVDLVELVQVLIVEERRRTAEGRSDDSIPMRPDHGHILEDDIAELPGYSWLGRLKALAELRGVITAVERLTPRGA
jgi:mannonate dehydratase